jgi:hypothetical protein
MARNKVRTAVVTESQRRFVTAYLESGDKLSSYLSAYPDVSPDTARVGANRILRKAAVQEMIDKANAGALRATSVNQAWLVRRFKSVYLKALRKGDLAAALSALDKLAKFVGLYERDNKQKAGTDSAEAIRERLRQRGIDVDTLFPLKTKPSNN